MTLIDRRRGRRALVTLPLLLSLFLVPGLSAGEAGATTTSVRADVTDRPTLATPAHTDTVTDVVLRWLPLSGVSEYELQVSPNGDWANNLSFGVSVRGVQYSPPVTLGNASYFWRVRGSAGTVKGPWSEERLFNRVWTPAPDLVVPADGDTNVTVPTFEWTQISGASRYELQVGTDVNFSPKTYTACITDHTTYTPYVSVTPRQLCDQDFVHGDVDPQIGVTYHWRVRGLDDPGNVLGRWSTTRSFLYRKSLPTPTGPANGSTVSAPVLTWDPVGDSEQYVVTINKRDGTVADTHETWATSYSPLKALKPAEGPFTWTVRTKDYNLNNGLTRIRDEWWSFNVSAPTGAASTPDPVSVTPQTGTSRHSSLTWAPVTGAEHYTVHYLSGGVFLPLQTRVPHAALTDPDKPPATGEFQWFVEAFGARDAYLGKGALSTFRITPNPLASYTAPCTAEQVCQTQLDTPTLRWGSVDRAGYYRVYLALDRSFTNVVREYVTQYTELTPRESLLDNQAGQSYYWFVRPCSGNLCGPMGQAEHPTAATFRKATSKVTGLKVLVEPSTTSLTWDDYLTARQYRVQVSASADFSPLLDDIAVDQTTYAAFNKTYPGGVPLYARVSAIDGSSNLLTASDTFTFTLGRGASGPATGTGDAPAITLSKPSIKFGDVVNVSIKGNPGAKVDLYSRLYPNTSFTKIRSGLTLDASGRYTEPTRPNYNLRLMARDVTSQMDSNQPLVMVQKAITMRVDRVGTRTYRFSGTARPAHPGQTVDLYRGTTLVKRIPVGASGSYSSTTTFAGAGFFMFSVKVPGTGYNVGSTGPMAFTRVY